MEYLTSHGVKFGENGISRTSSCHNRLHTYYLCESTFNIQVHEDYLMSIGLPVEEKKTYNNRRNTRPYKKFNKNENN